MIAGKTLAGLVTGLLVVGGGVAVVAANTGPDTVVVTSIVDGDTIDVSVNGEQTRVRLLNVDAPETVHPDENVQCMGPEAAALLEDLLPVGTHVELKYDTERNDRYGRDLAGVFVEDVLVNAEIARAGLGTAVLFEPNDRFYDDVLAAQNEAMASGRGLYDPQLECTFPAQVSEFTEQADQLLTQAQPDSQDVAGMESYLEELAAVALVGAALSELVDVDANTLLPVIHRDNRTTIRSLDVTQQRLGSARARVQTDITAEKERIEAERLEAERLEAERLEAERLEAERLEAERLEAERLEAARLEAERLEAERLAAERRAAAQRSSSSSSSSSSGSNSSSYDGYTGCRAYGGGYVPNAIDEKGRPYTKIDCTTKLPLP